MPTTPTILSKIQTAQFRALKQSKVRKQENLFLLEGVRLCQEALRSELKLRFCIIEKGFQALELPSDLLCYEANRVQLEQISDSKTPQGIICIAEIPPPSPVPQPHSGMVILVLDRIADPGNLGTILRSALWFGVKHVLLGPGCVDPYSPKAVRASMGALGQLQLHLSDDLAASSRIWQDQGGMVAALHMSGSPLAEFNSDSGLFLIVGSEAHGVDPELLSLGKALAIPRQGEGESLNAAMATSIALYELARKKR